MIAGLHPAQTSAPKGGKPSLLPDLRQWRIGRTAPICRLSPGQQQCLSASAKEAVSNPYVQKGPLPCLVTVAGGLAA